MLIKYVYVVFIGILIAIFVGVGIAAFYEGPKPPQNIYARPYLPGEKEATDEAKIREQSEKEQALWQEYDKSSKEHNKNVSVIAVSASILILIVSLTLFKKILLIADGLLLGGVLTLLYSIIRSFNSQDFKYIFIVVSIGLIVALTLGYLKFIKPSSN